MKFLGSNFTLGESNVVVFGVSLGKNSQNTLERLRYISNFVETFDIEKKINLTENVKIADIGNIPFDKVTKKIEEITDEGKVPFILGGNHLLSFYVAKTFKNDTKLIVFDAHADFKDSYDDEKIRDMDFVKGIKYNPNLNDATWLRRISEIIHPKNIILLGVRSCDEFEFENLENSGIKYFTTQMIQTNPKKVDKFLNKSTSNSNVYISIDMDIYDPSIAPAVDHLEPSGLFFSDFQKLIDSINGKLIGADLCCVNSMPNNEITEFLATRSLFELLFLIK